MSTRAIVLLVLLAAVTSASADDDAPARYYFASRWPPHGSPIPPKEIEIDGTPKARQMFADKPICVPYSPTNQLTLKLKFQRLRLITGFRLRVAGGDTLAAAKAHGRIRELTIETELGVVRAELLDETVPPVQDDAWHDTPSIATWSRGKFRGTHGVQFGFAPLLTYKKLEPAPTQYVTLTVSLYWVGDKVQDVCISNLEVLEAASR